MMSKERIHLTTDWQGLQIRRQNVLSKNCSIRASQLKDQPPPPKDYSRFWRRGLPQVHELNLWDLSQLHWLSDYLASNIFLELCKTPKNGQCFFADLCQEMSELQKRVQKKSLRADWIYLLELWIQLRDPENTYPAWIRIRRVFD